MERFYLIKESLVATLLTLIVTFGISFIPIKYEFTKAIREGFLGFDIYDLYYAGKELKDSHKDNDIVLVEIDPDRQSIAQQISILEKYSPTVIGIDAFFEKEEDPTGSLKLMETLQGNSNIIVATKYVDSTKPPSFSYNFFDEKDHHYSSGYINFVGLDYAVIRNYPPFLQLHDSLHQAFSTAIVNLYSPKRFDQLKSRNKKVEIINYTGNLESYTSLTREQLVEAEKTQQLESIVHNKIVLLGYFIKKPQPLVIDDLHFSPLNEQISGKSCPDMYGVVIQANIISMVLAGNYVAQSSAILSYFYAFSIIFLFLLYMLSQYKKRPHPKHGKFLLIQFLLILLILYLFLQVFDHFHLKTPLLPIMIALVLCVELMGLYRALALWLHSKYDYKTVFTHQHII